MEGPGMSLFQGTDSFQLKLSSSEQRQEEEEDFEDQQRRNKELGNLLTNAFDDLIDDDDEDGSSIVSDEAHTLHRSGGGDSNKSVRSRRNYASDPNESDRSRTNYVSDSNVSDHYKHCYRSSPGAAADEPVHPLPNAAAAAAPAAPTDGVSDRPHVMYEVRVREAQRLAAEADKWRRQVALANAEKARLQVAVEHQAALVEAANSRVGNLETEVATLKQNVLNAENSKTAAEQALVPSQKAARELQFRVDSLQSLLDSFHRGDNNRESSAAEARHRDEVKALRKKLEATANDYALKTVELDRLTRKMADVQREHQVLLVEKAGTIDGLTASLAASQRQVQQLRDQSAGDIGAAELKELNMKLKEELERCIAGGRVKVEEAKKLQELLDKRDETIQSLQEKSTLLYNECKRFEGENARLAALNEQLVSGEWQLRERLQAAEASRTPAVEEVDKLKNRLELALAENENVKRSYVEICQSKDSLLAEFNRVMAERGVHVNHSAGAVDGSASAVDGSASCAGSKSDSPSSCVDNKSDGVDRTANSLGGKTSQADSGTNGLGKVASQQLQVGLQEVNSLQSGNDLEAHRIKLQRAFDVKLRETEELIKEETIKLFADELEALEAQRDAALEKLLTGEKRSTELGQKLDQSEKAVKDLETRLTSLGADFETKVGELREASKRFDEFRANCSEAFARARDKHKRRVEREGAKAKRARKEAKEARRASEAKEKYLVEQFRVLEDGYQSALVRVQQKIEVLLGIKSAEREP